MRKVYRLRQLRNMSSVENNESIDNVSDNEFIEIPSDNEVEEVDRVEVEGIVNVSLVNGEGVIEESDEEKEENIDEESDSEYDCSDEESDSECDSSDEESDSDSEDDEESDEIYPYSYLMILSEQFYDSIENLKNNSDQYLNGVSDYIRGSFYSGLKIIAVPATFVILGFLAGNVFGNYNHVCNDTTTINICKPEIIHIIHDIHHFHPAC